jgi:hypothetical protein
MDANGHESGTTTGLSPQKTGSSRGLLGSLKLARFGACSRLPATNLPSVSLIPSGRFKQCGSLIRVSVPKNLGKSPQSTASRAAVPRLQDEGGKKSKK